MKSTPQQRWLAAVWRAVARLKAMAGQALGRLRGLFWVSVQASVAAGLAWYIAHDVLRHAQPFFAPISTAVCLSASTVLRAQRAVQMIFGVSLGIGIGTVLQALLHTSALAVSAAVLVALCISVVVAQGFIAHGLMFFNQTAVSAILVITLPNTGTGAERLFDALIGGGIALVFSALLFPVDPVALLRPSIGSALAAMSGMLTRLMRAIDTDGRESADADWTSAEAERLNNRLADLAQARATAGQVVRLAPRRRADRPAVENLAQQATQITLLASAVCNLVRVADDALRSGETLPVREHAALGDLADGLSDLATHDLAGASRAATQAADPMVDPNTTDPTGVSPIALLIAGCGRDLGKLAALAETCPVAPGRKLRRANSARPKADRSD